MSEILENIIFTLFPMVGYEINTFISCTLGHAGTKTCLASIAQSDFLEYSNKFHHAGKTGFLEEFPASFITGVEIQSFHCYSMDIRLTWHIYFWEEMRISSTQLLHLFRFYICEAAGDIVGSSVFSIPSVLFLRKDWLMISCPCACLSNNMPIPSNNIWTDLQILMKRGYEHYTTRVLTSTVQSLSSVISTYMACWLVRWEWH